MTSEWPSVALWWPMHGQPGAPLNDEDFLHIHHPLSTRQDCGKVFYCASNDQTIPDTWKKKFCSCRTAAVQHPVKCQFIRHSLQKALVGITRMNIDCEQIVSIGLRVSIIMLKVYKRKACKGKTYIDDFKSQSFVSHRTCVLYCHAI